jgi:gas vesicle protein
MDKRGCSSFLAGVGLGAGAGVFAGMLLAPKTGRETRQVIRNSAVEGEEYLERRGAEFRETLKELIKSASRQRDNLSAVIDAAREAYRKACSKDTTLEPPPGATADPGAAV